jgi:hypothetical protein
MARRHRIDALHAASPIIVAEYLRKLADKYDIAELHEEANELDPDGTPRAVIVLVKQTGMMHAIMPSDWFCPVCMIVINHPGVHDWASHDDRIIPPTIMFRDYEGPRNA